MTNLVIGLDVGEHRPVVTSLGTEVERFDLTEECSELFSYIRSLKSRSEETDIQSERCLLERELTLVNGLVDVRRDLYYREQALKILEEGPSMIAMEMHIPPRVAHEIHGFLQVLKESSMPIFEVPSTFASSQLCSLCGGIHKTNSKTYRCPRCGYEVDRDLNAARNLVRYAVTCS